MCKASFANMVQRELKNVKRALQKNFFKSTIEEVGNTAAFLLSDLSSGITGEITYVDAGYSINALNVPEEA